MQNIKDFLFSFDAFAISPTLNIKQNRTHHSVLGVIFSYLLLALGFAYFIYAIVLMLTTANTTSVTLSRVKNEETLNFAKFSICLYGEEGFRFNRLFPESYIIAAKMKRNNTDSVRQLLVECTHKYEPLTPNVLCMCLSIESPLEINKDEKFSFLIYTSQYEGQIAEIRYMVPSYAYDADRMSSDLVGTPFYSNIYSYDWSGTTNTLFWTFFDKELFEIDDSFFFDKKKTYEGTRSTGMVISENLGASDVRIELKYSDTVHKTTKTLTKFPDVVAEVLGLYGTLYFTLSIIMGGYFEFAFFRSIIRSLDSHKTSSYFKKFRLYYIQVICTSYSVWFVESQELVHISNYRIR